MAQCGIAQFNDGYKYANVFKRLNAGHKMSYTRTLSMYECRRFQVSPSCLSKLHIRHKTLRVRTHLPCLVWTLRLFSLIQTKSRGVKSPPVPWFRPNSRSTVWRKRGGPGPDQMATWFGSFVVWKLFFSGWFGHSDQLQEVLALYHQNLKRESSTVAHGERRRPNLDESEGN